MTAPSSTLEPPAGSGSLAAAPYAVKVHVFEGPLDLLLHLIRINEVEVTDIPIAQVSEQYLAYLGVMRELNLDVAGEYLLMAATLAWIKSRMLLPVEGEGEDGEPVDPRAELVARLLEYQRFKEASQELGDRNLLGRDVYAVRGPETAPTPASEREIEVGLFELVDAFRRVLRKAHSGAPHEVKIETITVRECMLAVMRALETREAIDFDLLILADVGRPEPPSRAVVVATFLAILELTRLAALRIYQGSDGRGMPAGPIHLRRAIEPGDSGWTERISELM